MKEVLTIEETSALDQTDFIDGGPVSILHFSTTLISDPQHLGFIAIESNRLSLAADEILSKTNYSRSKIETICLDSCINIAFYKYIETWFLNKVISYGL